MAVVDVDMAFFWECPSCGHEQFERAVVKEFSAEERAEMFDDGVLARTGDWVVSPEIVICNSCDENFEARDYSEDDDFGDDEMEFKVQFE